MKIIVHSDGTTDANISAVRWVDRFRQQTPSSKICGFVDDFYSGSVRVNKNGTLIVHVCRGGRRAWENQSRHHSRSSGAR